ncbi:phasin family protein [Vibrio sp.]|uniref:phasin family protein n=1 Tax=Vibrio sp. TaxID=678 RepID=UPI003D0CAA5C
MVNETIEVVQEQVETTFEMVTGTARKVFWFGLGTVALVQENLKALVENTNSYTNKMVEKGEVVEKDGRKMVNEFVEPYQKEVKDRVKEVEKQFNQLTENVLNRVNVPSATNIEDLNKKVAGLGRKVDQLKKAQTA